MEEGILTNPNQRNNETRKLEPIKIGDVVLLADENPLNYKWIKG